MFATRYAKSYDIINSTKNYEAEVNFVYRWAGRPESVFDIGCGTASYWKYYPKKTVLLGVDSSRSMARGERRIIRSDIRRYKHSGPLFDCSTALFDVLNYIPKLDWLGNIPVRKGGYFIFDVWDKKKVDKEGFRLTGRQVGTVCRVIDPVSYDGRSVELSVTVNDGRGCFNERHKMTVHSHDEIVEAASGLFDVCEIKRTVKWQTWYKLRKR